DFDAESDGILRLELVFTGNSSDEGVYIEFQDEALQAQFGMTPKNGVWTLYGTDEISSTVAIAVDSSATYAIVMDIDLDNHTMSAIVNNVLCGSVSIPDAAVSRLVLGTTKKGTGSILFKHARLSKNYPLNEHFLVTDGQTGQKPADGWQISGDFVLAKTTVYAGVDNYSIKAQSAAGTVSSAKKLFTPVDGKVVFETFILLPQKTDGASVSLLSNGNPTLTLETKNGSICIGDTVLHDYAANVWQCLRIEADTAAGKADIKIDGKTRATFDFDAAFFDGVTVAFAPQSDAVMWFDDVLLYRETEHGDYPSYPQVAASDGYNIGLNVCPLWHDNIASEGWDAVSPFPEFETYLGYYDEGTKEAMDWELKLMAEHGIDFMHVCWYALNNVTEPIKNNHRSYTYLHDAYMNAEYSDLVDFCLMWENGGKNVTSLEQFKTYIWSYWLEYYFSDPRYARLDNKAVLSVWSYDNFLSSFGGEAGAKAAVEFMNEDLKRLGYDGILLLTSVASAVSPSTYTARANAGFDASYAYHWGENGYSAAHQISGNSQNLANSAGILHHIPTVSMGFNDVGRNESRSPIITGEDHLKVCESIKEMLDGMNTGTWKDNTLFVSTWNEFSEGTYVLPTASNGFDYLENLRAVFTNDTSDHSVTDAPLTEAQLTRITRMYPDHHSPLRWFETEESDIGSDLDTLPLVAVRSYDMATTAGTDAWEHQFSIDN
ncbi:MAG: glycoside hydrolase family 99-like domain-containing protein, partial [Eubacteriales bacterium]